MREELGVEESGLATVIREAFALLDLISFFTAGQGKEARAWADPSRHARPPRRRARSTPTWSGASWRPRSRPGRTWCARAATPQAREQALQRVEGRDYVMRDGDVATFRFTP